MRWWRHRPGCPPMEHHDTYRHLRAAPCRQVTGRPDGGPGILLGSATHQSGTPAHSIHHRCGMADPGSSKILPAYGGRRIALQEQGCVARKAWSAALRPHARGPIILAHARIRLRIEPRGPHPRFFHNLHKPLETEQICGVAPRRPVCRRRD